MPKPPNYRFQATEWSPGPNYDAGFREVAPNVFVGRNEVVVIGIPANGTSHNCDEMGCGYSHVLWRHMLETTP